MTLPAPSSTSVLAHHSSPVKGVAAEIGSNSYGTTLKNQIQLITYVDRLSGDLQQLRQLLNGPLSGLFGGVHLLPFFNPIDGADAGFDHIDHTEVDARL